LLVENGARPEQRVLTGRLDQLHDLANTWNVVSPAMVYIGEFTQLAPTLGWWGQRRITLTDTPCLTAAATI